jgi:CRISPR-associated protein Csd2
LLLKRMAIKDACIQASAKFDQVRELYECHNHRHAIAILTLDYPELLSEICDVLLAFRISLNDIKRAGGNESQIPKILSKYLRPMGWEERKLNAEMVVDGRSVSSKAPF